ncbi:hypothetical protein [Neobacillus notoginsengisoli]|uniref:hypothetical protein n=1 Tax=Neobacillus notoginsengisoli TaxID=1578198 RepID=UPI001314F69A|nr:hypothetical protein [Neobacillus notoginsengisoli]
MKGITAEEKKSLFLEILKRAYEKGMNEAEMTSMKMIEDLKTDLKNMPIAQSETI